MMPSRLKQFQATRNLPAGMALIFLACTIFVAAFSWSSWQSEKQAENDQLSLFAELSGKSINTYFTLVENNLSVLDQQILEADGTFNLEQVQGLLRRFKQSNPEIANVNIADLHGQVLVSAVTPKESLLPNISQQRGFVLARKALLNKDAPFIISRPTVGQIVNEWVIPIRYAVRDKKGRIRYILNAPIPLAKIQNFWHSLYLPKHARMGLLGDDGFLLGCQSARRFCQQTA